MSVDKGRRLEEGILEVLEKETGIGRTKLSQYVGHIIGMSKKRAFELEAAARKLGADIPAQVWMFGKPEEIRVRLNEAFEEANAEAAA